jgi:hypothetical protein
VVRTDHDLQVAQLVAAQQEALFRELSRRIGTVGSSKMTGRFEVRVFREQERYLKELGPDAVGTGGLYVYQKKMLAAWGSPERLEWILEVLRHEGTHQFVMHFIGMEVPVWLNEGLAVFYEHSRFKNGRLELGEVPLKRVVRLKKAIKAQEFISLDRMLRMSAREWVDAVHVAAPHAGLQYDQAWAMVHFLAFANNQRYRGPFTQFIYSISRGRRAYLAWGEAFGTNFDAFEQRWKEYIGGLDAVENLPCRDRLRVLGYLVARFHKKYPEAVKDMPAFRKSLLDKALPWWSVRPAWGVTISRYDREGIALLFRCPADDRKNVETSYELVPGKDGGPPVIRCDHHIGYLLETRYEQDANDGGFSVKVITKPNLVRTDR